MSKKEKRVINDLDIMHVLRVSGIFYACATCRYFIDLTRNFFSSGEDIHVSYDMCINSKKCLSNEFSMRIGPGNIEDFCYICGSKSMYKISNTDLSGRCICKNCSKVFPINTKLTFFRKK